MQLIPIHTPIIRPGDDLASIIAKHAELEHGDIITISSKVSAVAEGNIIHLHDLTVSEEAEVYARQCGRSAAFCEAVLQETERMHGSIAGTCPGALLTEVKPDGLKRGVILTANAGLDESNVEKGTAVGWPEDCASSAQKLRQELEARIRSTKMTKSTRNTSSSSHASSSSLSSHSSRLAVIITDSNCRPRRWGVTAFALSVSGLDPLVSQAGVPDIFGKPLRITTEALADQLATAGNMLMGNAGQTVPACIIRGHGFPMSDFSGWVDGIEPAEDLFKGIL